MTKAEAEAVQQIMAIIRQHRRHEGRVCPIEEETVSVDNILTMYLSKELDRLTASSDEHPCQGGCADCQKCQE